MGAVGVQLCVKDGRIRQYTTAAGDPMAHGVEMFEYEARPSVWFRGGTVGWLWCITRASAVEGRIRSEYEAAGERGRSYEALEGSTVLQDSVGAFKRGRRLGPASY